MIIAVEGMDGSGKTTVCSHIERTFNFINVEKPTKYFFEKENGTIDFANYYLFLNEMYKKEPEERSAFFGKGNILAVKKYENCNIVLDRHIVSNYYWNGDKSQKDYYSNLIATCGLPDLTIFLYATPLERFNRLQKRNSHDMDLYDKSIFDDGTFKHIEFMEEYGFNYVIIDTNEKTIKDVCLLVDKQIKKMIYGRMRKRVR